MSNRWMIFGDVGAGPNLLDHFEAALALDHQAALLHFLYRADKHELFTDGYPEDEAFLVISPRGRREVVYGDTYYEPEFHASLNPSTAGRPPISGYDLQLLTETADKALKADWTHGRPEGLDE